MSDIETMIQEKALTAPRITPAGIDAIIGDIEYAVFNGILTICVITLSNGFMVTGESACASPENFDAEIGQHIAYKNAVDKIWSLEGYLLKQQLYKGENIANPTE